MSLAGRESFLDITERKRAEKALEEHTEHLLIETCPQPEGILALYQDITERKQIEAELRESEDRFRTAFEEAPYGMCLTGLDGRSARQRGALPDAGVLGRRTSGWSLAGNHPP